MKVAHMYNRTIIVIYLVADGVKGRLVSGQADDGVGAALLHRPRQLEHVQTALVANLRPAKMCVDK